MLILHHCVCVCVHACICLHMHKAVRSCAVTHFILLLLLLLLRLLLHCYRHMPHAQRVLEEAAAALENPLLVGQPLMPEEGGAGADAALSAGATGGGIFMGRWVDEETEKQLNVCLFTFISPPQSQPHVSTALWTIGLWPTHLYLCAASVCSPLCTHIAKPCSAVNPNPEPDWSGAHKGLALYVSRLLAPVWEARLVTPSASNTSVWKARLSQQTLTVRHTCV
jgi:hypothetical protein